VRKKRGRIHSFQIYVCGNRARRYLISNSGSNITRQTQMHVIEIQSDTVLSKCNACFRWFSSILTNWKCHTMHQSHPAW